MFDFKLLSISLFFIIFEMSQILLTFTSGGSGLQMEQHIENLRPSYSSDVWPITPIYGISIGPRQLQDLYRRFRP